MKTIQMVQTFDGQIHPSESAAKHHLDEKFGALITGMSHKLVRIDSYKGTLEFLEGQIETMRAIVQITDDMKLEQTEED